MTEMSSKHALKRSPAKTPISILIHHYQDDEIESCLEGIFTQKHLDNFEIIICDDTSEGTTWEIANRYIHNYPGKITITRNHTPLGRDKNKNKGLKMCRGDYIIELTGTMKFDAPYLTKTLSSMAADAALRHSYIFQNSKSYGTQINTTNPLVSVCIYNYNYGRYLKECLQSVFEQTYQNIEIHFSDNASTDESWDIAMEYCKKHPKRISMTRNRMNFGAAANLDNCIFNAKGKYILKLCSDDAISPLYLEHCVSALEHHPEAAFAMVHRHISDDSGKIRTEPSFYDGSYLIPGNEQAAVYMMTSVNPSVSQILYKTDIMKKNLGSGNLGERWFGDRIADFCICLNHPIIYISEPLLINRVHNASDGDSISQNLIQCIGEYCLVHQFAETARHSLGMEKAAGRLPSAIKKIGDLCLRYATRSLIRGDIRLAQQYIHLSFAINPEVENNPLFQKIQEYFTANSSKRKDIIKQLQSSDNLVKREISYPPPDGSIRLSPSATS